MSSCEGTLSSVSERCTSMWPVCFLYFVLSFFLRTAESLVIYEISFVGRSDNAMTCIPANCNMWQAASLLQYVIRTILTHFFILSSHLRPTLFQCFSVFLTRVLSLQVFMFNVLVLGAYWPTFLHKNCHSTSPFREAQRYVFNVFISWAHDSFNHLPHAAASIQLNEVWSALYENS